jgi:Zn-dependent protease/CBS domain-containing protein
MPWSITIARVAGSEIRIHITFLLLLAGVGIAGYRLGSIGAAVDSVLFVVVVFACVALHELGHSLAARRYGIPTLDITLFPIGGLARLSRIPERPSEEIVIALAGPAVNVVIATILMLFLGVGVRGLANLENPEIGFGARLASINIFLALFNLIPAFPMDGGQVLRAALWYKLGRRRATEIAVWIGNGLAFALGLIGLYYGDPILLLVAIFVFLAARAGAGRTGPGEMARRIPLDRVLTRSFESLAPQSTVEDATALLRRTTQREFPVLDAAGHFLGMLTRADLIRSHGASGPGTLVDDVMSRDVPIVTNAGELQAAVDRMQSGGAPYIAVAEADCSFIGYISREHFAEVTMLAERKVAPGHDGKTAARPPGQTG